MCTEVAPTQLVVLCLLNMFWAFLAIIKQFNTRQLETPKFSVHDYVFMVYTRVVWKVFDLTMKKWIYNFKIIVIFQHNLP